jgi:hypothetical protein
MIVGGWDLDMGNERLGIVGIACACVGPTEWVTQLRIRFDSCIPRGLTGVDRVTADIYMRAQIKERQTGRNDRV